MSKAFLRVRSYPVKMARAALVVVLALIVCLLAVGAHAQTSSPTPSAATVNATPTDAAASRVNAEKLASLEQAVADAKSSGDNAWMLMSAALVLMMTGPGLALFYGGLVRKKNVLATMMQSFAMMAIVTLLWGFIGFQPGLLLQATASSAVCTTSFCAVWERIPIPITPPPFPCRPS